MRISDWSSDVCSCDLIDRPPSSAKKAHPRHGWAGNIRMPVHRGEGAPDRYQGPPTSFRTRKRERRASRQMSVALKALANPHSRRRPGRNKRSEEHTSELQSLMRTSYAVFCLKKKHKKKHKRISNQKIIQHA